MNKKVKSYTLNISALVIIYVILSLLISTGTINSYISGIIITIGIAVIMAVSLNLTTGLLGQLALGHAGFMSIGAYTAALITKAMSETSFALSLPIGLIAGGLMAALFGLIIGMPALRLKGDYLAIITLGFGEIIRVVIENLSFTGGAGGLSRITRMSRAFSSDTNVSGAIQLSIVFWVMVIIIASIYTLGRSRHGRAIISIRENEVAAEATG
ncbi:MAG: branched-chain amino acid ABC transporter permease, partial [Clostridiales bacterium]|nr:branched-chain amino acid ABC transporter permease [Clostridiales bacterium]